MVFLSWSGSVDAGLLARLADFLLRLLRRGSERNRVRNWYLRIRSWIKVAPTAHAKLNIKLTNQHKCEKVGVDAGTGGGGICEEAELCEPAWSV